MFSHPARTAVGLVTDLPDGAAVWPLRPGVKAFREIVRWVEDFRVGQVHPGERSGSPDIIVAIYLDGS